MNIKGDVQATGLKQAPWVPGAELASELAREPYPAILDALPLGVFVLTAHGSPFFCNRAGADILGRGITPDTTLETLSRECQAYRADTNQLYPTDSLPIVRALRGEACTANDIELRHKSPSIRLNVWAAPLFDSTGKVQFALATFAQAQPGHLLQPAELHAGHERERRQSQKLEAVGQLAAGVAHEINTPMQYIGDNTAFLGITIKRLLDLAGSFERLLAHCHAGAPPGYAIESCERELKKGRIEFLREQAPSAIEQSLAGIDQVRSIVQALKEFSHPGDEGPVLVDMNHVVKMAVAVTRSAWRLHADLRLELDENLQPILGHAQEIGQVLINLIVNAAHAIEERCMRVNDGRAGRIVIRSAARGREVEIQVEDNGAGIPDAIRDQVMTPFFTTKPVGKGTGQGLALARSVIVDRHGGKLSFSSVVDSGTTFSIHLTGQCNA